MKILIIGSGGREHALAWKFAQNNDIKTIFVAPGNNGIELLEKVSIINLKKIEELVNFAKKEKIDLTIVGSEELLVEGIVDIFKQHGLSIFGPDKKAAMLEGSKAFSKNFMQKYNVSTAKYKIFDNYEKAISFLDDVSLPIVIKASGLAAGKGVIIAASKNEAIQAIKDILLNKKFKEAGSQIVIEEFLEGQEVSILSFTDSKTIIPCISAQDHKKINEGETGLNTGGMGVIAPNPYFTDEVAKLFIDNILKPTLKGIQAEKMDFAGVIFFGLMLANNNVYLLEYNMRLGDPETQAVLPLMKNDLYSVIKDAENKNLKSVNLQWFDAHSCCVVAASKGYPESYTKGEVINGMQTVENLVFFAGIKKEKEHFVTNGGRVFSVVATANTLKEAQKKSYSDLEKLTFNGMHFRKDIGKV